MIYVPINIFNLKKYTPAYEFEFMLQISPHHWTELGDYLTDQGNCLCVNLHPPRNFRTRAVSLPVWCRMHIISRDQLHTKK